MDYNRELHVVRIVASMPGEALELALGESLGSMSVWEDADTHCVTLEQYFEDGSDAARAAIHLRESVIPSAGVDARVEVAGLKPEDWRDAWKLNFKTERVSEHIVITPPWEHYSPREGDCVVGINPGLSFGTGQHATTRCCLQFLDRVAQERPGASLLDVGCGSGILSIAAVRLGFNPVLAIDNDSQAIAASEANFRANRVHGCIQLVAGDLQTLECGATYEVVVANLIPNVEPTFAELLSHYPAGDAGVSILSGILNEQYEHVISVWNGLGFRELDHLVMDEWSTGLLVRETSHS